MRERVGGSADVGRAPGCVRTQGTLPGIIWTRGMWWGVATQGRTHRTHGTQEMRRLRQDATPTDEMQGPFLLMYERADDSREPIENFDHSLELIQEYWDANHPAQTMPVISSHISKKKVYSRRIGPASGRRASASFVPYVLNVRLCVLCVLNVLNVRASKDCTSCAWCLPTPLFPSSPPGALVTA